MKPRHRVVYNLTSTAIAFVTAVAEAADVSRSSWLSRHLDRMARGESSAPPAQYLQTPNFKGMSVEETLAQQRSSAQSTLAAPPGVPADWVRVTLVESDAGKTAYMSPADAGLTG